MVSKLGLLWSRLVPDWAGSKIDNQLYVHNAGSRKSFRLPRGIEQKMVKTPDGEISTYRIGSGPAVIFVHGWEGGSYQFFSLMRGLKECGFTAIAFDHLGHEQSEAKPATLEQVIKTTNHILRQTMKTHAEGVSCVVTHGIGATAVANVPSSILDNVPLFLISPIFNFKLYLLKKLGGLKMHPDILKQYAQDFVQSYPKQYAKLELADRLKPYAKDTVIAHDSNDQVAPVAETLKFCKQHPKTKLLLTRELDHQLIVSSESVWQELKKIIQYEDSTVNYAGFEEPEEI